MWNRRIKLLSIFVKIKPSFSANSSSRSFWPEVQKLPCILSNPRRRLSLQLLCLWFSQNQKLIPTLCPNRKRGMIPFIGFHSKTSQQSRKVISSWPSPITSKICTIIFFKLFLPRSQIHALVQRSKSGLWLIVKSEVDWGGWFYFGDWTVVPGSTCKVVLEAFGQAFLGRGLA